MSLPHILLPVTLGLVCLFAVLKYVSAAIWRRLEAAVLERFPREDILACDPGANFFGERSRGGRQIRGNGALVLTREALYFLRAAPEKEYRVALTDITGVTLPKTFNGKSIFFPLLCVSYRADGGDDAMAWAVRKPRAWREAIERARTAAT
jgi:hypothetical protein